LPSVRAHSRAFWVLYATLILEKRPRPRHFQKNVKAPRVRFDFALKSAPLEPQGSHGDLLHAQSRHHAAQETWSSDLLIPLC
jgi:hypothetical protein